MAKDGVLPWPRQPGGARRLLTSSVGIYFSDPDGNGIEVYYEDLELYRRGVWERGQFPRKLQEATPGVSHS